MTQTRSAREAELEAKVAQLERELEEMTAGLSQAWDQLVPFLQAGPTQAKTTQDIMPLLESVMAAMDAQMGAVYLARKGTGRPEWFTVPSDVVALSAVQRQLEELRPDSPPISVPGLKALNAKPTQWMFAPMVVSGTVVGAIGVGLDEGQREFTALDARMMARMTERAAGQIVAENLAESQEREAKLAHELQIAGLIQRSIQPATEPEVEGLQVAADWRPAASVGGDAWGWVQQPSGRLAAFMVDVAGKGLPAALAAVSLHTALKLALGLNHTPADVIRIVNTEFYEAYTAAGIIATANVITIDPQSGLLEQANAGHTPLLVWTKGEWQQWRAKCPPLGVLPDLEPVAVSSVLMPGDSVICFSDGLSEIETADGGWWGIQGILSAVNPMEGSARALARRVLAAADAVRGSQLSADDQTLLAILYDGISSHRGTKERRTKRSTVVS